MVYQSFKYFFVRIGLSLFLMLTAGFGVLFFIHEVALPGVVSDDDVIQWVLMALCLFFGFIVYSVFGEYQFEKAVGSIRNIDFHEAGEEIVSRFRRLLRFTETSYFLPEKGRRLRREVLARYAGFLLNCGREDEEALNIYLKAYLQNPKQKQFRDVLITVLGRKENLTDNEIDLLIVALRSNEYRDLEVLNLLVALFLEKQWFTSKTEAVYLHALENQSGRSDEIIHFLLPRLLDKNRADHFAISFYFEALGLVGSELKNRLIGFIGTAFLDHRFEMLDPELHQRCRDVFENCDEQFREHLVKEHKNQSVAERWKQVRIFRAGDGQELDRLKSETGLAPTGVQTVRSGLFQVREGVHLGLKSLLFHLFDSLNGAEGRRKWVTGMLITLVVAGGFFYFRDAEWVKLLASLNPPQEETVPVPRQVVTPHVNIHTIQVAAVTVEKQARKIVKNLEKKQIEGVYIVKTERKNGGFWYKIRLGKFGSLQEAQQYASSLVERKAIRNFFIISLGEGKRAAPLAKTDSPSK